MSDYRVSVKLRVTEKVVLIIISIFKNTKLCERIERYTARVDYDYDLYICIYIFFQSGFDRTKVLSANPAGTTTCWHESPLREEEEEETGVPAEKPSSQTKAP